MLRSNTLRFMNLILFMTFTLGVYAQQAPIQYFRPYDQSGINVFETSKVDTVGYDGIKLRIGANFTQQFQSLKHSNSENMVGEVNRNALYK